MFKIEEFKPLLLKIYKLAIPITFSRCGIMTMSMVDAIMVSYYSDIQLSYLGAAEIIVQIVLVTGIGLISGAMILTATSYGEKDYKKCGLVFRQGVIWSFIVGIIMIIPTFFGETILTLLDQKPEVITMGSKIMLVYGIGLPFQFIWTTISGFFESIQKPIYGLMMILVANILNIPLDYFLIYGIEGWFEPMGAIGSAWATTSLRIIIMFVGFYLIYKTVDNNIYDILSAKIGRFKDWVGLRRIGYSSCVGYLSESTAFSAMLAIAGSVGVLQLAAYTMVSKNMSLVFMFGLGLSGACMALVGEAIGAKNVDRAKNIALTGAFCALITGIILGLIYYVFRFELARLMGGEDEYMIRVMAMAFQIILPFFVCDLIQIVISASTRTMGAYFQTSFLAMIGYFLFMIPMGYWLGRYNPISDEYNGTVGLVLGANIGTFISMTLFFVLLFRTEKKLKNLFSKK